MQGGKRRGWQQIMHLDAVGFFLVWKVKVELLYVQPAVLVQVEDFAVFEEFSVMVSTRPPCFLA